MIDEMIRSFADRQTEVVFSGGQTRRLSEHLCRAARRRMLFLDAGERLSDLWIPPGNRLEKLRGDRAGQHSVRVNDQWRICFRWHRGDAHAVEIVDYHRG